ncbi:LysR substrate-binding domain-containing protein [Streptomyces tricolor]|nr:LysR substrate-binding domain-containing protein [Streptomyces tricolor]
MTPGVRLDLGSTDPADPLPEVLDGRADLAVVVRPRTAEQPGLRLVHLLDDPYRAVLPKGHPLAARRVLDLADLAGEPWVGSERPGPCLDTVLDACAAAGFRPRVAVDGEDYRAAQGFVAAGLGGGAGPAAGPGPPPSGRGGPPAARSGTGPHHPGGGPRGRVGSAGPRPPAGRPGRAGTGGGAARTTRGVPADGHSAAVALRASHSSIRTSGSSRLRPRISSTRRIR